jgi:hypothetical protein
MFKGHGPRQFWPQNSSTFRLISMDSWPTKSHLGKTNTIKMFQEFCNFLGKNKLKIIFKNKGYFPKDLFDILIPNTWEVSLKRNNLWLRKAKRTGLGPLKDISKNVRPFKDIFNKKHAARALHNRCMIFSGPIRNRTLCLRHYHVKTCVLILLPVSSCFYCLDQQLTGGSCSWDD